MSRCSVKILSKNEYMARSLVLIAHELDFKAWISTRADGNINIIDSPFPIPVDCDFSKCIYLYEVPERIPQGVVHMLPKPFSVSDFKKTVFDLYEQLYTKSKEKLVLSSNELLYEGESVMLTQKESKLLSYLIANANKPVSREEIMLNVWGKEGLNQANITDVYINYLRQKIRRAFSINVIKSVRSVGYMYTDNYTQTK